jgi:hypothetical protein
MDEEQRHKEIMTMIRESEERNRRLYDQHAPMVGVFYVIQDSVYCEGAFKEIVEPDPDGIRRHRSHEDCWDQRVCQFMKEMRSVGPYEYPRGRIVYHEDRQRFFLYADWCILEEKKHLLDQVLEGFNLSRDQVEVMRSLDYQCAQCRNERLFSHGEE